MSHSAEKCKRGIIWDLLTYILWQNIKKLEGGPALRGHLKIFEKVAQCRKNRKGVPFCWLLAKLKKKKATLCTKFALTGLDFSGYSSFSKKWTDQCGVFGDCKSRAFFLKRKTRRLKTQAFL